MANIGKVGKLIVKRSRGKTATTVKDGGTTLQAARGKLVGSEKKKRIITGKTSSYDRTFDEDDKKQFAKEIKKRGRTAVVLKQVRTIDK